MKHLGAIIAGTGHRPDKLVGGFRNTTHLRLTALARTCLERIQPELVISGMALGWDRALAVAAIEIGVPFHAYIPFDGQELKWPAVNQKIYGELRALASKEFIIASAYSRDAMMQRNEAMVDACTGVLALFNGGPGGTRHCVDYARSVGRPIVNVWGSWERHAGIT